MRVYYFTSEKWGLINIKRRRLKVSRIKNLNDPFDCYVHIMTPEHADYRFLRDEWHEKWGMLCFSRDYFNPVQWSHYADRHRGMALGFDVDDGLLEKVEYFEEPQTVFFTDINGTDQEWREVNFAMKCKFIAWQYEEESRVFYKLKNLHKSAGLHYKNFDDSLTLKEIILGCNSTISNQEVISAASELTDIKIRKGSISEDVYEVRKAVFIANI